jgi:uncharacterized protein (TIGR02118 family)
MVVVYRKPEDVEAFERHYFDIHVPLAKKLRGLRKYEVSRGPIVSPSGANTAFMVATLHFDDMVAIREAFATEIGRQCAEDRQKFAPDESTFDMYLFDDAEI